MASLRMHSNKITKKLKNVLKVQSEGVISRVYMYFGTENQDLKSIFKPEVELMVFLRMRSITNFKKSRLMSLKYSFMA